MVKSLHETSFDRQITRGIALALREVDAGSGRRAYHFVFESHAFWIILRKPGFSGVSVSKDLEVFPVSDLFARIHVDQHGS